MLPMGVLLAGGCHAVGDAGRSGENASRIAAYDINPAPRGQVRDGGILRVATTEFRTQWNYWHLGGTNLDAVRALQAMMPSLFRSDQNGRVTADPDYLAGARITRTRPRQVITYDLNPKARWSDGTPLGYRDFRALWRACGGRSSAYQITSSTGYDRIDSVTRGSGDQQVVVTFARPFGEWRGLFSPLYPARAISTPAQWNDAWVGRIPITAGPFKPEKIDPTAETISIVRDPAWWGHPAKLDRVVFRYLARDAMPGAFANGEIDTFDIGADAAAYRRAAGAPGAAVRRAAGPDFSHLTFNGAGPVLSDVEVRRAVAMAIDRRAVARSALKDLDWPVRLLNDHVYLTTQVGYRDNAGQLGVYDPTRAAWLLDQAGWRLAGRARRKDGRLLTLRYVYPRSAAISRQSGELVQAMLGHVGVKVDLRPVPDSEFFDKYLIQGEYDLAPFSWIGTPYPISNMRPVYGRSRDGDPQQNIARIGSRRLDAELDRAAGELDPVRARQAANRADTMIWQEVHSLTLYQRPQIVASRQRLANWGAFGFYDPAWTDIGFTSAPPRAL